MRARSDLRVTQDEFAKEEMRRGEGDEWPSGYDHARLEDSNEEEHSQQSHDYGEARRFRIAESDSLRQSGAGISRVGVSRRVL